MRYASGIGHTSPRLRTAISEERCPGDRSTQESDVISTADLIQPAEAGFVCVDAVSTADLIQPAHHPGFVHVDAVETAIVFSIGKQTRRSDHKDIPGSHSFHFRFDRRSKVEKFVVID